MRCYDLRMGDTYIAEMPRFMGDPKTAMLYGVGVLLYLPLNYYAGQLSPDFFRRVIFDGSFYHLWYLPALLLGTPIAYYLSRSKNTEAQ